MNIMNRQQKLEHIISFVKRRLNDDIIPQNHLTFGSDEITNDNITPEDILQTLQLLQSQPNCVNFEYKKRYENETAMYEDNQLYIELQESKLMLSDVPGAYERVVRATLATIDFSVEILPDFDSGVQNVLNDKAISRPRSSNEIALKLYLDGEQLFVLQVHTNKRYKIKDLSKSGAFCSIIKHAVDCQNEAFDHRQIYKSSYNAYDLLGRIFGNAHIYKAFFTISEKHMLTAHFAPTYADIENMDEDFQTIIDALEDLKAS